MIVLLANNAESLSRDDTILEDTKEEPIARKTVIEKIHDHSFLYTVALTVKALI